MSRRKFHGTWLWSFDVMVGHPLLPAIRPNPTLFIAKVDTLVIVCVPSHNINIFKWNWHIFAHIINLTALILSDVFPFPYEWDSQFLFAPARTHTNNANISRQHRNISRFNLISSCVERHIFVHSFDVVFVFVFTYLFHCKWISNRIHHFKAILAREHSHRTHCLTNGEITRNSATIKNAL